MLRLLSCCFQATTPSRLNPENAFNFSVEEQHYLVWLNKNQLTIDAIREKAGELLSNEATLRKEQNKLLQYVLYSRVSKRHSTAASNAISILIKSGFPFEGLSLQNVSIPHADLTYAILTRIDFTGANLTGVNFSRSSLSQVNFTQAILSQINLGVLPSLHQGLNIVQMAILKDKKQLVSLDIAHHLAIWDLNSYRLIETKYVNRNAGVLPGSAWNSFFVVSRDERYILLLGECFEQGEEEKNHLFVCLHIFDNHTSKNTVQKRIFDKHAPKIQLFTQTKDGDYLLFYDNNVGIWELITDLDGNPQFNKKNPKMISHKDGRFSYHCESNRLAFCTDSGVDIYSVPELSFIGEHQIPWMDFVPDCNGIGFTTDGECLTFAGKNEIHLWHIKKRQHTLLFSEQEFSFTPVTITRIKLFPKTSLIGYYVESDSGQGKFCIRDISKPDEILYKIDRIASHRRLNVLLFDDRLIRFEDSLISNIPLSTIASQTRKQQVGDVTDVRFTSDSEQLLLLNEEATAQKFRVLSGNPSSERRVLTEHHREKQLFFRSEWPEWKEPEDLSARRYVCTTSANAAFLIGEYRENGIGHLCLSEVDTGIVLHRVQKNYLAFAVSKDGRYIVFFREGELELWDIKGEKSVKSVFLPPFLEPTPRPHLAISEAIFPEGHVVVEQNHRVHLWHVVWQEPHFPYHLKAQFPIYPHHSFEGKVKFSGDTLFYTNESSALMQYNLINDITKPVAVQEPLCVSGGFDISEDKNYLIGVEINRIILWDIQQNRQLDVMKDLSFLGNVRFSPNGRFIASWGSLQTYVWEIENHRLRLLWQKPQTIEIKNIELKDCKDLSPQNAQILKPHQLNRHQTEHQNLLV